MGSITSTFVVELLNAATLISSRVLGLAADEVDECALPAFVDVWGWLAKQDALPAEMEVTSIFTSNFFAFGVCDPASLIVAAFRLSSWTLCSGCLKFAHIEAVTLHPLPLHLNPFQPPLPPLLYPPHPPPLLHIYLHPLPLLHSPTPLPGPTPL